MQTSVFDSFSRRISITAITGYQRYISPHKGFRCAHRVLHGGESCSGYVKRQITEHGLKAALIKSQQRFIACKHANQILHAQIETPELPEENAEIEAQNPKKAPIKTSQNSSFFNTNQIDCVDLGCNCAELLNIVPDCSLADCSLPDFAAVDCSSLDCGAADCSFLDCGGCSW
ncbi:membrane protein insertion efficiency factor YidD [Anabaena sp. UHCC 0187]|uniref:membrane protein insertion efficiency factor YidD n=1 Tax=Anabaena sp. UHCC 0187 TaxID=2590018 RepID=UPI001447B1D2|nr:membrane protein insertion efficiency factor YidD [Anabaena sp. UHCC 0187]MDP5017004.1 membrane protein insertion efficiency factor YidD [Dolichospermum sp.]MTJ11555.1 membrane protein insertion efficiency factor YidD [Anabaena sp. UHCC 0187]